MISTSVGTPYSIHDPRLAKNSLSEADQDSAAKETASLLENGHEFTTNASDLIERLKRNKLLSKPPAVKLAADPIDDPLPSKARAIRRGASPPLEVKPKTYIKTAGWWLDPRTWWSTLKSFFRGEPQNTQRMISTEAALSGETGAIVIDGFDDAANALQGSGISKQLAAALQSFLFYPLLIPLVNMGAQGSVGEWNEVSEGLKDHAETLEITRKKLSDAMARLDPGAARALDEAKTHESKWRKVVVETLRGKAPEATKKDLATCLVALAEYDTQCRELVLLKLKRNATPFAVVGTHAMLGGVASYWAGSLAQFASVTGEETTSAATTTAVNEPQGSAFAHIEWGANGAAAAATGLALTGHAIMFVGQAAMAIYGGIATVEGVKQFNALRAQRQVIETAPKTLIDEATQNDLLAQNTTQKKLTFWGKIFACAMLCIGQIFMMLGGALVGLGLPLLIAGAVITIAAIALRFVMDKWSSRLFAFDPKTFDRASIPVETLEAAVQKTQQIRRQAMTEQAWISIAAKIDTIKSTSPDVPLDKKLELLDAAVDALHKDSHETALHGEVKAVYTNNRDVWKKCLESKTPGLSSFVSLLQAQGLAVISESDVLAQIALFESMSRSKQMTVLLELQGLDDEWQRRTVEHLVVREASRSNRRGKQYGDFLQIDLKQATQRRTGLWGLWQKLLGDKEKTAYAFNLAKFKEDLAQHQRGEIAVLDHVEDVVYATMAKSIRKETAFQVRSRLFGANAFLLELSAAEALRKETAPRTLRTAGDGTLVFT